MREKNVKLPTVTALFDLALAFFVESGMRGSFNGIRADQALEECGLSPGSREPIAALVAEGHLDCIFASVDLNPHIKRMPELKRTTQLKLLATEPMETICLYPARPVLAEVVDRDALRDQPFSRAMLLGAAQLEFDAFDLAVLGRYRMDPRYNVTFEDYVGRMNVSNTAFEDEAFPDRDKISVQSFGLGFDDEELPYVVAFYRYLANLTPEHQQLWNSYRAEQRVRICEPYYRSAIVGDFWENKSVRYAISEEMRLINEMAEASVGKPLFRQLLTSELPFDLSAFLVPSTDSYDHFVLSWDKMLSDNMDRKFFADAVELEREEERRDGKIVVVQKASLALLNEWLEAKLEGSEAEAMIGDIMAPLRAIRAERQNPAHRFRKNEFSKDFHAQRRRMLASIFDALTGLREVMSSLPGAERIKTPAWLRKEQIDVF